MVLENNAIYITPNNIRKELLLNLSKENELKNIKFFSLKELIDNLTFTYDEKAIYYLMNKYNYKYNNAKTILDNLRYIADKDYNNKKLNNLVHIKNEIDDLLIYNEYFKDYILDKKVYIYGYDFIDKFDLDIISNINYEVLKKKIGNYKHNIYEFKNLFDEVTFISDKIRKLISNNVPINKIKLINLPGEYSFILKEVFNMHNLNIDINNENIYSSKIVKKYLELYDDDLSVDKLSECFNLKNDDNLYIYNKIIDILNKYNFEMKKEIKREILINEFKNIKVNKTNYVSSIEVKNINDVNDDEYAFFLGFNEGNIPIIFKDEDYLSDKEKKILGINTSYERTNIEKENIIKNIKSIKNLTITYKLKTPFNEYYPSSIIDDLEYDIIKETKLNYNYSNLLNKIKLSKDLDNFVKYGEKSNELEVLFSNYKDIKYMSFDNKFKGINKEKLYKYINDELVLSYTSLDNFYKCKFRYYLTNILKLDKYEETFAIFIGNLFHHILSICFNEGFDFEKEYTDYLVNYNLNNKDKFFVNKLKQDLLFIIETIKKQYEYSEFENAKYENEFEITKDSNVKVKFIGFIDKLLYKEYKDKTLLVIVDYKTGNQDLNLYNCYYGLNMQLPIYLYLSKTGEFKNAEVIGFYLQKILTSIPKIDDKKDILLQKEDNLKLQGYSLYDEELLNIFDRTYENSRVIKSLAKSSNGFRSYSKLLTKNQMVKLEELVNNKIDNARDEILNANFEIDPKRIGFNNVSCKFCKFKDICYMNENNIKILEEIKDLNFLGGEENANMD